MSQASAMKYAALLGPLVGASITMAACGSPQVSSRGATGPVGDRVTTREPYVLTHVVRCSYEYWAEGGHSIARFDRPRGRVELCDQWFDAETFQFLGPLVSEPADAMAGEASSSPTEWSPLRARREDPFVIEVRDVVDDRDDGEAMEVRGRLGDDIRWTRTVRGDLSGGYFSTMPVATCSSSIAPTKGLRCSGSTSGVRPARR